VRPYYKTEQAVFCPNQNKVDAWYTARKQAPEYGFNLNFQWLGRLAQQQDSAQKGVFIRTFNKHDGQNPVCRHCRLKRGELHMNVLVAFVDGHVKLQNLDHGCGNPSVWEKNTQCQQWQACNSGPIGKYNGCCPENYGCSGVSGNSPDFP